jgi:peptide subunit release factor 1 (eRF1)
MELNSKVNSLKNLSCLRCNNELNITSPSPEEITFYQCPQCDSHYTLHKDKSLTDRWGMPISLVLYGVIFVKRPVNSAKVIAEQLALRDDIDLAFLIKNIHDELQEPTQKVSKMLDFIYPDETALREFLKVFNEELTELIK